MLFTTQEIQATLNLLNRTSMSPAEQLFAQGFFQRLAALCAPEPEPSPPPVVPNDTLADTTTVINDAQAMADAMAIAKVLDEEERNGHTGVADQGVRQ